MKRLLLAGLLLVGAAAPVLADTRGIVVSPPAKQLVLEAGQTNLNFTVDVANTTSDSQSMLLSVVDFGALDESGGVFFSGQSNDFERKYGLAGWLKLDQDQLNLSPGTTTKVGARIADDGHLTPGGHYGAILFKIQSPAKTGANNVEFKQILTSLVFLRKSGGENYDLKLNGYDGLHNWRLPTLINLRFRNDGNVHIYPRGTITITDPLGRQVARGVINPDSGAILPETYRVYPTKLDVKSLAWLPGRYKLTIAYRREDQAVPQIWVNSFWFINLAGLGLLSALLLLLALAYKLIWPMFKHRHQRSG